jgi:hypothetical protein
MNSLKFVTQIKGVYQFVKEEAASPTHNLSDPHSKEGEGSREGPRRTSTFSGWQLGGSPPAGSMGTIRRAMPQGLSLSGGRQHGPSSVGGAVGLRRHGATLAAAPQGHEHGASAAAGGAWGSFGRQCHRAMALGG